MLCKHLVSRVTNLIHFSETIGQISKVGGLAGLVDYGGGGGISKVGGLAGLAD